MYSAWFRSTFFRVFKFLQIKEGWLNLWMEPILWKVWVIWSPLLYLNFKCFTDPNSSSCSRFQCILHDSWVLLSESWNFYKLKKGDLISGGTNFTESTKLQKRYNVWQFKDHNFGMRHENQTNDLIFLSIFWVIPI